MSMVENKHFHHPPFQIAMEGFSFTLPPDWEVGGYELNDPLHSGILSFTEIGTAMGQFSWRKVKDIPDIPRIIEEIHRRWLVSDVTPNIRFTRYGKDGKVVLAHTKMNERFYAAVFNRKMMFLCEWIFPKYSKENAERVVPMLESFSENDPDKDTGRTNFSLFGLEVSIPAGYHFLELTPYPAAVTMDFENIKHYKISVHRFGMADVYMQGADTANFYHRCLYARKYAIKDVKTIPPVNGCEAAEILYQARGKFGFDFLLGPWWCGFGSAFLKSSENRVYAFEHLASRFFKERETLKNIFRKKLSGKG